MFRNAFPGTCKGCNTRVKEQKGFREKTKDGWIVWCEDCCPERKAPVVRRLTEHGQILWPFDREELDLVRAFPGARFVGRNSDKWEAPIPGFSDGYWTCSLLPGDRARVLELADRLKLEVPDILRDVKQSERAVIAEDSGLYGFQVEGVDFLHKSVKALLGDDMGLGKTIQALMALHADCGALCIVPANVKYNWQDECHIWRKDLKPVVLSGRGSFRLPKPGEVVIVNFELLPKEYEGKVKDKRPNWDHLPQATKDQLAKTIVVVDEAHKVKNYKTQRAKRVTGIVRHAKATWGLTGTPLFNRPLDLWGTLSALGMQWEVFKSFSHFVECFNGYANGWGGYEFGSTCKPVTPELLRRVMLRRLRTEVLPDLPSKTYTTLIVDIQGRALRKKLDALLQHCEIDEAVGEIDTILHDIELAQRVGRRSLPPFEAFSEILADLADNRIPAVLEYAEECEDQDVPLVVFSAHVGPCKALAEREGWGCITGATPSRKRRELVRDFQAGKLKGLACTIIAAGVGLTLTRAWKCLFVDLDWVPANNWQAEDRICRIGQTSNVCEIVRMVSNHVLEQHVHILLAAKIALIQAAIEATIKVDPKVAESDGETEEEFEARMARVEALKAEQLDKGEAELAAEVAAYDAWLDDDNQSKADADIPF